MNPRVFRWWLLLFIGWASLATAVQAETLPPQIIEAVDLSEMEQFLTTLDEDIAAYLPQFDPKSWSLSGPEWDLGRLGKGIVHYFLREIIFNLRLLGQLFLLAVSLAIFQNMQHAFESDTINQIAFGIGFLIVMGLVLNSYRVTFAIAQEAVTEMTHFMYAIIPLIFSLIAAGGGMSTVTIVHPLLISAVGMVAGLIKNLVFPFIFLAGVCGMVGFISSAFPLNKLANLLKNAALAILGLTMTIFIGVITIRGFAASVADSMALRTMKYFSSSFLPVVGGTFSDTIEMASGCSMVLKSGLGIFGLGLVILITIFPLIKILAVAIIYQLSGALVQPLGNSRLADTLQMVGEMFVNLFGAVSMTGLMFFIAISILVGVSGLGIR